MGSRYGRPVCPAVAQSVSHPPHHYRDTTRMSETKPSSELLSAIKTADSTKLKDVTPVENPAAKHDMAMFGVAKFDKNKLNSVETVEKNSLPTADDLKDAKDQEKSH